MSTPVRRGDAWDPIWSGSSYARADRRAARARVKVAALAALRFEAGEGDRVLELGCGSGHNTLEIAARTRARARWIACDRSSVATRAAWTTFDGAGLDAAVLAADAVQLPFRASSIDAVLAFMVLHHLPRSDDALAEIDRVLADGDRLGVVVPGRWSLASATSAVRRAADSGPTISGRTRRALRAGWRCGSRSGGARVPPEASIVPSRRSRIVRARRGPSRPGDGISSRSAANARR
jgi:SAM-dependent methyltransferase